MNKITQRIPINFKTMEYSIQRNYQKMILWNPTFKISLRKGMQSLFELNSTEFIAASSAF